MRGRVANFSSNEAERERERERKRVREREREQERKREKQREREREREGGRNYLKILSVSHSLFDMSRDRNYSRSDVTI